MDKKHLEELAMTGNWSEKIIKRVRLEHINGLDYGLGHKKTNLLGLSAQFKTLDKLPKEFFNPEGLDACNGVEETVIHYAAMHNQLCYIPKEFLNEKNLNAPNIEGTTPINYACLHLCLHQIPRELISRDSLIKTNDHGLNAFDFSLYAYFDIWEKSINIDCYDLKENRSQFNTQVKIILTKLTDKDIKDYYKVAKESSASPINNQKKEILRGETLKRKLLMGLKDTASPSTRHLEDMLEV